MKTINSIDNESNETTFDVVFSESNARYACWYIEFDKETSSFKVGIKSDLREDEYIFTLDGIHSSKTESARGLEFALSVLDKYKHGGKKAVKAWISENKV